MNATDGGIMEGVPVFLLNVKDIPYCFMAISTKASITPEILVYMLRKIDSDSIYNRRTGSVTFLLLSGHYSHTKVLFLKYLANEGHQ